MENKKTKKISQINDFFIRWLLGQEGREYLLLNFINAFMLNAGLEIFKSVKIINPYNLKNDKNDHETVVDVRAETDSGEVVIIEIQVGRYEQFANRALYYWAKNYIKLREAKIKYHSLKPIFFICILNFTMDKDFDLSHTTYDIRCRETDRRLTDKFLMHFFGIAKAWK